MNYDPSPVTAAPQIISFDDTAIAFSAKSDAELRRMYWLFASMNSNFLVNTGTAALKLAFQVRFPLVKSVVKHTVFQHFCGGETIAKCEKTIQNLWKFRVGTILDYSVEGAETDEGFEATTREIIATIDKAAGNPAIPFSVFKVTGVAPTELLIKMQRKATLTVSEQGEYEKVRQRVERICRTAHERNVRIFVDAEETQIQDVIDTLAYEMMEKFNRGQTIVYNTYQLYRWDILHNLKNAHADSVRKGYFLGAKLVRGAYMEKERREAVEESRRDPIQPDKMTTDRDFDEALEFCVQHYPQIAVCAGTHNEKSTHELIRLMHQNGISPNDPHIFFAQLYGMSDNLSYNLAYAGYNVAKYVPYGPVEAVMPYLFRRASENTAIAGQTSREFNLIRKEIARRKAAK
jgi:proline dehydrogenase